MNYRISGISIENFKSYASLQRIGLSDLSVFLGANSSGKSSALQVLLALKQTMECNSRDIELLLSGQYIALGDFQDVVYDKRKKSFSFQVDLEQKEKDETSGKEDIHTIKWVFEESKGKSQALLGRIEINFGNRRVLFEREESNKYRIQIENEKIPVVAEITNLGITGNAWIKYDSEFNNLFAMFINDLSYQLGGKKALRLAVDEFVSEKGVTEFYIYLMNRERQIVENKKNGPVNNIEKKETVDIASRLSSLIDDFYNMQNPLGNGFAYIPLDLRRNFFYSAIAKFDNIQGLVSVYEKYKKEFENYACTHKEREIKYDRESPMIQPLSFRYDERRQRSELFETVSWAVDLYNTFERILLELFFVGPIRENPKGLYSVGFEQIPKYVGPTGSNFASVLLHENKRKEYILPYDEKENTTLWEALNEWAAHLNIANAVEVANATSFGIKVSVSDTQNKTADIMNVGIGTSQVLPVLITGLLSEKGETLVFEQPELHLHPFSQSRLADFFVSLINHGRKIIIETHSEAFILRLRYHVLKGNCDKNAVAISFFQNKQGTKVFPCSISGYGMIDYPDDFKDETQELLNDIMNAALTKDKK